MASKNGSKEFFVTHTNPEIFTSSPRLGSQTKIMPPKRNTLLEYIKKMELANTPVLKMNTSRSRAKLKIEKERIKAENAAKQKSAKKSLLTITSNIPETKDLDIDSCPKDFIVKKIVGASPWCVEFSDYLEPMDDSTRIPDPFQDSVDMLAMTISVVMLLSRGYHDISPSHYKWVYSYLDCLRDECGNIPPNCQGILNHINEINGGKIKSFLDVSDDDDDENNEKKPPVVKIFDNPPEANDATVSGDPPEANDATVSDDPPEANDATVSDDPQEADE